MKTEPHFSIEYIYSRRFDCHFYINSYFIFVKNFFTYSI
jgi:hypothetical protein